METLERIPTKGTYHYNDEDYNWIDYNGRVFIIKYDANGDEVNLQIDGTMCRSTYITGFLYKSFKTKNKWFNPNWWYKKTTWSKDKDRIYFHETKNMKVSSSFREISDEKYWEGIRDKATEYGRPVDNILKTILKEVSDKTGLDAKLDFKKLDYGYYWYEAYIPIKIGRTKYILTWENCD